MSNVQKFTWLAKHINLYNLGPKQPIELLGPAKINIIPRKLSTAKSHAPGRGIGSVIGLRGELSAVQTVGTSWAGRPLGPPLPARPACAVGAAG